MSIAWGWFALFSVPFFIVHFGVFLGVAGRFAIGGYSMVDDVPPQGWEIVHPIHGEVRMFWLVVLGARVDSA